MVWSGKSRFNVGFHKNDGLFERAKAEVYEAKRIFWIGQCQGKLGPGGFLIVLKRVLCKRGDCYVNSL